MNGDEHHLPILRRKGVRPFPPRVSSFTRPFWEQLGEGRLTSTICNRCSRLTFPPKPVCRGCWSDDIAWRDIAPDDVLYSFTRVHVVPRAFLNDALYEIGIVDLSAGIRLMCRMVGDFDLFVPDMPVSMVVLMYDDGPLFGAQPKGRLTTP